MPLPRKKLGALGELLAKRLLLSKGYTFVCGNFSCRLGEIDLIFKDKDTLVFVEVKTRYSRQFGLPEEAVTLTKLKSIRKTIAYFYLRYPLATKLCRIDVVTIDFYQPNLKRIQHFQNVDSN